MASWVFFSDAESWSLSGNAAWDGVNGHGAGCISGELSIGGSIGVSLTVAVDDPWSYWLRIVADEGADTGEISYSISTTGAAGFTDGGSVTIGSVPYDSGWLKVQGTMPFDGEITAIAISIPDNNLVGITAYFDTVYFAEAEPGGYALTHSSGGMPGAVVI